MAQICGKKQVLVSTLMITGVTWNDVKFLTSCKTVSYTKRTALYVVIYVPVKHLFFCEDHQYEMRATYTIFLV